MKYLIKDLNFNTVQCPQTGYKLSKIRSDTCSHIWCGYALNLSVVQTKGLLYFMTFFFEFESCIVKSKRILLIVLMIL